MHIFTSLIQICCRYIDIRDECWGEEKWLEALTYSENWYIMSIGQRWCTSKYISNADCTVIKKLYKTSLYQSVTTYCT